MNPILSHVGQDRYFRGIRLHDVKVGVYRQVLVIFHGRIDGISSRRVPEQVAAIKCHPFEVAAAQVHVVHPNPGEAVAGAVINGYVALWMSECDDVFFARRAMASIQPDGHVVENV